MDTDEFIDLLIKAWAWIKKFTKFFIGVHFTCWEDFIYFCALYGGFIVILITYVLSAYLKGYDDGETAGLIRGFVSGTTWAGSGK
jgi:hypothetical protein